MLLTAIIFSLFYVDNPEADSGKREFTDKILITNRGEVIEVDIKDLINGLKPGLSDNPEYRFYANGEMKSSGTANGGSDKLIFNKHGLFSDYQAEVIYNGREYVGLKPDFTDSAKSGNLQKVLYKPLEKANGAESFGEKIRRKTLGNISYVLKTLPADGDSVAGVTLYDYGKGQYKVSLEYYSGKTTKTVSLPLLNDYVWIKFDEAFTKNSFLWDDAFISWFMLETDSELSKSTLDFWYSLQIPSGENKGLVPREIRPENYTKFYKDYLKHQDNINPISVNDMSGLNINNPFILSRIELELYKKSKDIKRLSVVLPKIIDYYNWVEKHRRKELINGGEKLVLYLWSEYGSGMDNLERCVNCGFVDLISQQAALARDISLIAEILKDHNLSVFYNEKYTDLKDQIRKNYYDPKTSYTYDVLQNGQKDAKTRTAASFWSLYAHALTDDQARNMINENLLNPNRFGSPPYFPAVSRDSSLYDPGGGYWKGGIWPPVIWIGIKSLEEYGYIGESKSVSEFYYSSLENTFNKYSTLFEYYSPEDKQGVLIPEGEMPRKEFYGWSSIPVALTKQN